MCGVIVVDAESIGLLVSDVMPICMIIALDIVMTLRDSINCSTVIRSPTVILGIMREVSSEHYGPRVYFTHYIFRSTYKNTKNTLLHFYLFIYIYLLSLSDLTLQVIVKGLTTPLSRWVQVCLFLRRCLGASS